jgi:hypothetical protein
MNPEEDWAGQIFFPASLFTCKKILEMNGAAQISFSVIILMMGLYPTSLRSQYIPGPGFARVGIDSLPVYSTNSPQSEVVKILKRGDTVRVVMEIAGYQDRWCAISGEDSKEIWGFVFCRDLESADDRAKVPQSSPGKALLPGPSRDEPGALSRNSPIREENIAHPVNMGSLLQAVWKEDVGAVRDLLEKGADPNAQTAYGTRLLHIAAKKSDSEMTQLLLTKGADVNGRDRNGMTALMAAASAGQAPNAQILLEAGADINARDDKGYTALMWATVQGFPDAVETLLGYGAEVNARSKDGKTAYWLSNRMVANLSKSLAAAFKTNSDVSGLQMMLKNHQRILQMLQETKGKE